MTCASCAASVEKKLNSLENVVATVNLVSGKATVYAPDGVPVERLVAAIEQAGYGAEVAGPVVLAGGVRGPAGGAVPQRRRPVMLMRRRTCCAGLW